MNKIVYVHFTMLSNTKLNKDSCLDKIMCEYIVRSAVPVWGCVYKKSSLRQSTNNSFSSWKCLNNQKDFKQKYKYAIPNFHEFYMQNGVFYLLRKVPEHKTLSRKDSECVFIVVLYCAYSVLRIAL